MNLAKPNKLIEYLTDGRKIWILYSHSGWENTIMAELNTDRPKIQSIISGREMKNRDKITGLQFGDSIKKVSVDSGHIDLVIGAYSALTNFVESNPNNELGQLLLFHCNSENIVIDTEALSSDFSRPLKWDKTADLLEIFRRVNLDGCKPEECACGVCCDLDTHIMRLEDERILDSKSHGRAIGVTATPLMMR